MIGNFQLRQCTRAWHWSNLLGNVLPGINSDDAGRRACSGCINAGDLRVCIHRTNKRNVQRAGQQNVVDIMCEASDQTRILGALYSFANVIVCH